MIGKMCAKCGQDKPLTAYGARSRKGRSFPEARCKACIADYQRQWRLAKPGRANAIAAAKRAKYAADPERHRALQRDWRISDPRRARDYYLRKKYGIGADQYDNMLASQGGGCAVCGSKDNGDRRFDTFAVDHDHRSGKVRGLLCSPCNRTLGQAGDSADRLMAMAAYLLQYSDVLAEPVGCSA